jgi:hypothetical protein
MENRMAKERGRKEKPYRTSTNEYLNGLRRRRNDGRWVVIATGIATGQMFTEPDEWKAIQKFHKLSRQRSFDGVDIDEEEKKFLSLSPRMIVENNAVSSTARGFVLVGDDPEEAWLKFWRYVGQQIRLRQKEIARLTGVEEIAYFQNVNPYRKSQNHDLLGKDVNISDAAVASWADQIRRAIQSCISGRVDFCPRSSGVPSVIRVR